MTRRSNHFINAFLSAALLASAPASALAQQGRRNEAPPAQQFSGSMFDSDSKSKDATPSEESKPVEVSELNEPRGAAASPKSEAESKAASEAKKKEEARAAALAWKLEQAKPVARDASKPEPKSESKSNSDSDSDRRRPVPYMTVTSRIVGGAQQTTSPVPAPARSEE